VLKRKNPLTLVLLKTEFYAITVVKLTFFKIKLTIGGAGVSQVVGSQLAIAGLDNRLTYGGKIVSPSGWKGYVI
jgi:hypothetical protein